MSGNAFKVGIFAANCAGGISATTLKERWEPTWDNNAAIARMADEAGLEFMLPLGRWAGYGGDTDPNGRSFETITWAAGLLGATERIVCFSTLHVAFVHPVFAAKQIATADHIGNGRFGLNIVCGWNPGEFAMFGIGLGDRDRRYDQGDEWLTIAKKLWTETAPFDFDGEFFQLKNLRAEPKPVSKPHPLIMNAGTSGTGLDFAVRNAEYLFRGIDNLERARADVAKITADCAARGRDRVGIFTNAYCVCRPTRAEAEEFHRYYAIEHADEGAVDAMFVGRGLRDHPDLSDEDKARIKLRIAAGNGAWPIIGTPDEVAAQMKALSDLGFAGIAMGLFDYTRDFPFVRDEVLPRLKKLGLRAPAVS